MAANIFTGAIDNNWGTATNWSLGVVPTASDTHITTFDLTSPNCTVNSSARVCNIIDFSGYTNTITMSNGITVSGDITLDSTMSSRVAGSGGLTVNATATLTSNGGTWINSLTMTTASTTITLADNWTVNGLVTLGNIILNGFTLNMGTSFAQGTGMLIGVGSTLLKFIGTGTWGNSAGNTRNSVTIDTAGTITLGASTYFYDATLTHINGTVVTTGNTFITNANTIFNCSGITFNTLITNGGLLTILTDISCVNLTTVNPITGLFNVYVSGNFTHGGNQAVGTSTIIMNGTGTWNATSGYIQQNIIITGTYNVTGTPWVINKTLTTTGGTVNAGTSTLRNQGSTFNTSNVTWYNVTVDGGTITLLSDFNVSNNFTNTVGYTTIINGLFNINIGGSLIGTGTQVSGTANIRLIGTGTWSGPTIFRNNLTIDTTGTTTIAGSVYYNTGILTYSAGTVVTTGSFLIMNSSVTLNTGAIVWNTLYWTAGSSQIVTLLSDLYYSGTTSTSNINYIITINGPYYIISSGSFFEANGTAINGTCLGIKMVGTGTWNQQGTPSIQIPVIFDTLGTITMIGNLWIINSSFTLISGVVVWSVTSIVLFFGTCTISISNPSLNIIPNLQLLTGTHTLLTDIHARLTAYGSGGPVTLTGNNIYIYETLYVINNVTIQGSTILHLVGEQVSWYNNAQGQLVNDLIINCGTLWVGSIRGRLITGQTGALLWRSGGTTTHIRGKVIPHPFVTMYFIANSTLINFHRVNLGNVQVQQGITLTMNEFFCGTPEFKTKVVSTAPTVNYNVTFNNPTPKKAFHVNIKNCTVTNRNQLNIINRDGNGGRNLGVLFGESGMGGFPINMFPKDVSYPTGNGMLNNMSF